MVATHRSVVRVACGLVTLCLIAVLVVSPANTTVVPDLDLVALTDNADLIVVGRATGRQQQQHITLRPAGGNIPAWVMLSRVDVEKVFKGHLQASTLTFRFVLPDVGMGYRGIPVGQFGVFFLRQAQGGYEVLNSYHPYVPVAPGAPVHQGNCVDKITAELAHVFVSRDPSVQDRWTRWEAVRALETLQTPLATVALRTAAAEKDPPCPRLGDQRFGEPK